MPTRAGSSNCPLGNQVVILGMRAYPDPENSVGRINAERAIMEADADGAEATNPLEV